MNSTTQTVNAVIFDLGGVLINLAPDRTRQAFIDLGIPHFDQLFTVFKATPLFDNLETGHTEIDEFITSLRKESGTTLSDAEIVSAWNAMLLDFRIESLNFIHQLRKKMPVYLFSNTNRIHYESFSQTFKKESAYPDLDDFFTKAYYSHDIGYRKPHPEGFQFILKDQQLDPATTLFVDDNKDNIKGAMSVGLQTHLLLPEESIEAVFAHLL